MISIYDDLLIHYSILLSHSLVHEPDPKKGYRIRALLEKMIF